MYGVSLYAVEGIHWKANITYTDKRAGWLVWTGLKADFVFIVDLNAAWRIIFDANITHTDLRVGD